MNSPAPTRRRAREALIRFLQYLVEIERALAQREPLRITALLRKRTATHLPREVREELLMLSRAPRDTVRAPLLFLRFQHRMTQLARAGEGLPTAQFELPLEDAVNAGEIRRRDLDHDRRSAACDPPTGHRPFDDDTS